MPLEIKTFVLGPLQNNVYVLADTETGSAVFIDPGFGSEAILDSLKERGGRLEQIWLTHAHFDHMAGASLLARSSEPPVPIALHPADALLWRMRGGGDQFGFKVDTDPEPSLVLGHGKKLQVGGIPVEVRHTPGHTPGHVSFYFPDERVLFCGDLIFQGSIGRTDFPGGSYPTIIDSIRTQVLTLPDDTRLLPGHGPETTVGIEREYNPYLA